MNKECKRCADAVTDVHHLHSVIGWHIANLEYANATRLDNLDALNWDQASALYPTCGRSSRAGAGRRTCVQRHARAAARRVLVGDWPHGPGARASSARSFPHPRQTARAAAAPGHRRPHGRDTRTRHSHRRATSAESRC